MKRGRPKGYSPYINIPYEDLADFVGRKTLVKVGRTWLEELIKQTNSDQPDAIDEAEADKQRASESKKILAREKTEQPKIEYELTTFDED